MPTKRVPLARQHRPALSPAAVARWREVRPWGIDRAPLPAASCITDDQLGMLLGMPALIAMPAAEADALYAALEEAIR